MAFAGSTARSAHADGAFEGAAYAAVRRPLASHSLLPIFPNSRGLRQNTLGLSLEVAREPPPHASGFVARAGVAVENRTDCDWAKSCPFTRSGDTPYRTAGGAVLAPSHAETGGHARVGYRFKYVQLEAGIVAYSFTPAGGTFRPPNRVVHTSQVSVVPDVVVRLGARGTYVAAGFGSYAPTTLLGPGAYLQIAYSYGDRLSTVFSGGFQDVNRDQYFSYRADLDVTLRVTAKARLGHGFGFVWAGPPYDRPLGGDFRVHVSVPF